MNEEEKYIKMVINKLNLEKIEAENAGDTDEVRYIKWKLKTWLKELTKLKK
jgi:ERCC4-related helicase